MKKGSLIDYIDSLGDYCDESFLFLFFAAIISFFFRSFCCNHIFLYIMNEVTQLGYQSDQTQTLINWKQCILRQEDAKTKGPLVLHPRAGSYHTLLEAIKERAILQDVGCVQIQRQLKETTEEMLLASNVIMQHDDHSSDLCQLLVDLVVWACFGVLAKYFISQNSALIVAEPLLYYTNKHKDNR